MNWVLQGFDSEEFIERYWQKLPCLIKKAFIDLESPLSPEELAGLACEEDVHSRLIMEKGGTSPWQLRYGPFQESDFLSLPKSHYSLLVSECEKWIPEFADLLDTFRFLPKWRIDDVMVSYAPPGGSAGPHVDEYDVFLLQIQGNRRWQYNDQRLDHPALLPDLDLAILKSFRPDQDVVLEPGDMLYLPPGIAHYGIAVDACMTCSIGFRAPTATETLESFTLEIDGNDVANRRYSDADLETDRHFGEITDAEINRFRQLVTGLLDQPQSVWTDAMGKLLSDAAINEQEASFQIGNLDDLFKEDWMINPDSKSLYYQGDSSIRFYCNGSLSLLPNTELALEFVKHLCGNIVIDAEFIKKYAKESALSEFLIVMANNHAIIPVEN